MIFHMQSACYCTFTGKCRAQSLCVCTHMCALVYDFTHSFLPSLQAQNKPDQALCCTLPSDHYWFWEWQFLERIHFLFWHPILTVCEEWQREEQENTSWNIAQPMSPLPAQQYPRCLVHEAISRTDDRKFSSLPAQAQRATWSPLRGSKQPFQYHVSSHTVKTQPNLVGQQDHHTSKHSSTHCPHHIPLCKDLLPEHSHTSPEVQHRSCGAACGLSQWRCTTISIVLYSAFAAHPVAPALLHPAWVTPTVWHGKYALSSNAIHSLIEPLQNGGIFSDLLWVICTGLLRCSSGCCHCILPARETGRKWLLPEKFISLMHT